MLDSPDRGYGPGRYRIIFLEECGGLDAFTYLDINGAVLQNAPGNLDDGKALTGMTFLQ